MKKCWVLIWVVMTVFASSLAHAQTEGTPADGPPPEAPPALANVTQKRFSLSAATAYVDYREPGLMNEIGMLEGAELTYRTRNDAGTALYRLDVGYLMGHVTYDGGDLNSGLRYQRRASDSLVNIRGTMSASYGSAGPWAILPFVGAGYRLLSDKIEGTGSYLRQISYFYLPLGAELSRTFESGSSLSFSGDVDWMVSGVVQNRLSDLDPSNGDVTMTNRGFGFHFEVTWTLATQWLSCHVRPYYQRWMIAESSHIPVIYNGSPAELYEPRNTSDSIGLNVGIDF